MKEETKKEVYSWIRALIVSLLVVWLIQKFLYAAVIVDGVSMEPTLKDMDRVIVSKMNSVERFDVVVFVPPHTNDYYIKRVIGVPGDKVKFVDDVLYINGKAYVEGYVDVSGSAAMKTGDFSLEELTGEIQVPDDKYFVLGDNRLNSIDGRDFGFITEDNLVGEAVFRFSPLNNMALIK